MKNLGGFILLLGLFPLFVSTSRAAPSPAAAPSSGAVPALPPELDRWFSVSKTPPLTGRLAFAAAAQGVERIFVLDLDARTVHPVINGPGQNSYPSWSPDGSELIFTSSRDGNKEVYAADWTGENQRRLTNHPGSDDNPSWSPDGQKVVFAREVNSASNLFTVSKRGGEPRPLTSFSGRCNTPRWSFDGDRIAYSTDRFWPGWDVCIWNVKRRVESCPLYGTGSYCRPSWSKDDSRMLFSYGTAKKIDIGLYDFAKREWQKLIEMHGREYDAVWSPDEQHVAFTAEHDEPGKFNIMLYSIKEQKTSPLVLSNYSIRYLSWSAVTTMTLEARRARGRNE